jgi:YD repeat-containing protein
VATAGAIAGERWVLTDAVGQRLHAWDSRGHTVTASYDALRRPTALQVADSAGKSRVVEQITYGEILDTPRNPNEAEALNLRGAPYEHYDEVGVATTNLRDFKNNIVTATRQLFADYVSDIDWSTRPGLAELDETFASTSNYDALNRVTTTTAPDGSITTPSYNQRRLLAGLTVKLQAPQSITRVVAVASYNAKGQCENISYGNGATTTYTPRNFPTVLLVCAVAPTSACSARHRRRSAAGSVPGLWDLPPAQVPSSSTRPSSTALASLHGRCFVVSVAAAPL